MVNFTNILRERFLYKSAFFAKILLPKPKCKWSKGAQSTFVQKIIT